MKEKLKNIIKFIIFLFIGILLFWLVYRGQNTEELFKALKNANLWWLLIAFVFSVFSHISRAMRWILLIKPLGYKPKLNNTVFAVFVMYLANTAIPRSGEVTRCGILTKYEKIPFTQLLGTVFIERVIDFVMLLLLLLIVMATQMGVIIDFFNSHPEIKTNLNNLFSSTLIIYLLLGIGIMSVVVFYIFRKKIKTFAIYKKIADLVKNFYLGIKSVKEMKNRWEFIGHSIFMWVMYFLMIYVSFKCFDATSNLSLLASLTVFVMASFGMVAPAPGGLGTWHFMVIETLFIYGIARQPDGYAFALVAHGSMLIFLVIAGFISLIALPLANSKNKTIVNQNLNK